MALETATVELTLDTRKFFAQLDRQMAELNRRVDRASQDAGRSLATGLDKNLKTVGKSTDSVTGKVRKLAQHLTDMQHAIGRAGSLALLAANTIQFTVAAEQALRPLLGLGVALPAIAAVGATAFGALTIGMIGVQDAFKALASGDIKKLDKALAGLAPSARATVLAVRDLRPVLVATQHAIQQRLFEGLGVALTTLARTALPAVRAALVPVAGGLNALALESVAAAGSPAFSGLLATSGRLTTQVLESFRVVIQLAVGALANAVTAGAPLIGYLAELTGGFLRTKLAALGTEQGLARMRVALTGGVETFKQLTNITIDLGAAFVALWAAIGAPSAGTTLANVERLAAGMRSWAESAAARESVASWFERFNELGARVGDVLVRVLDHAADLGRVLAALPAPVQNAALEFLAWSIVLGPIVSRLAIMGAAVLKLASLLAGTVKAVYAWMFAHQLATGVTRASWLATQAELFSIWLRLQAMAVASAARTAAAWVASAAVAVATIVTSAAVVVASWVVMATQSLIQAARMAVAWLIAMGPIGWIIAGVIALVALIIANWDTVRRWTVATWQAVSGAVVAAWNWLASVAMTVWNTVLGPVFRFIAAAAEIMGKIVLGLVLIPMVAFWKFVLAPALTWLWQNVFQPAWATISEVVTVSVGIIRGVIETVFSWVTAFLRFYLDVYVTIFTTAWRLIREIIDFTVGWITAFLVTSANFWRDLFTAVWNGIVGFFRGAWAALRDIVVLHWNLIRGFLGERLNEFNGVFRGTWNGIATFFGDLWRGMVEVARTTWGGIREAALAPVRFVVNTVLDDNLIPGWNKIVDSLGLGFLRLPTLPRLAAGAMMTNRPTVIVGEGNPAHPEYVIPSDPKYRDRATALWADAGNRMGFMASGGIIGAAGSVVGAVGDVLGDVGRFLADPLGAAREALLGILGGVDTGSIARFGRVAQLVTEMPKKLVEGMATKLRDSIGQAFAAVAGVVGAGVERWAPVVLQALAIVGQPATLLQTTLRRMNQESGGDPTIVNRSDVNWQRGTPSVGLMQVIGPTYRAYRHPAFDVGPYLYGTSVNALANILASMRYALARYGSLPTAYNRPGGYDFGGILPPGASAMNLSRRPEMVRSAHQEDELAERLDRVIELLSGRQRVGVAVVVDGKVFARYFQEVELGSGL